MKKRIFKILLFVCFFVAPVYGTETVGTGMLKVVLLEQSGGMVLSGIYNGGTNLMQDVGNIFSLDIKNLTSGVNINIDSSTGWSGVTITNDGTHCVVTFSDGSDLGLPGTLSAILIIDVNDLQSQWDLEVTGISSDFSLMQVTFPELKIKAAGNDYFLLPKYSGKAVPDPLANNINYSLLYPRGWAATMQMSAYYNNDYGIYLGSHDPHATIKTFNIKVVSGYISFAIDRPAPNKSVGGNDWSLPGVFELDLFNGNWYDAAIIYREWASSGADYWPQLNAARKMRQQEIGRIGVWGYFSSDTNYPMSSIELQMTDFADFFPGTPVGIHWYQWNYKDMDDDYPKYFPERVGMTELVSNMQQSGMTYIMPYINGRLYDTDLPDYATGGYPDATKQEDGTIYYQDFNGNHFAVMCPVQTNWQNIIVDASTQLTERVGCRGIYIDQVCASGPVECMDSSHHHALGGGSFWRDGYNQMLEGVHASAAGGRFITVEGCNDYLADEVDGFLTDGWTTDYLVPAFQAVYGDRVQFFGTRTGTSTYNNPSFYCKLAQAFAYGIEPGRFSLWIVHDANANLARPFVKNIAVMRYKLREFLSFGVLQRPLPLTGSIPDITSTWYDYGAAVSVTISAIQSGVYKNTTGDKVAVIFANASMTSALDFSFNFTGLDYGIKGSLLVSRIEESVNEAAVVCSNSFTQSVHLPAMQTTAYIISRKPFVFSVSRLSR